jgi:sporulation protein YlmC with PRC-barrel domain
MADRPTVLVKLSDSGRTVADPAEDVRGRTVRDSHGEEIGKVDDLLVDTEEEKVRFLRVEHGGILGFGKTPSFVPVDAVSEVTDDEVRIDQTRERVAHAPQYDPELTNDAEYYGSVYGHYGYPAFWYPGYVYPGYPPRRR